MTRDTGFFALIRRAHRQRSLRPALRQEDCWNKSLRAFVYAANATFNPLNLIVSKPLVTANHALGALLGALFGIVGTISFALLLLGIRRRFKIE
jgi:hypothetical protein